MACILNTGFSALNAHRFRCRLNTSPACDACGAPNETHPNETRAHYLLHCSAWDRFRRPPLQDASYATGILGAVDLRTLLTHPDLTMPVVRFIAHTTRFLES
jgi:hypothetical protein